MQAKLSIYGLGGTGTNIISRVLDLPKNYPGYPEIEMSVMDTSDSNATVDELRKAGIGVYHVPGLHGAGSVRSAAYETGLASHVRSFAENFKPGELSIVIFSTAGGTGSIAGPMLVRDLMMAGRNVVAFIIDNSDNLKRAQNTYDTLRSLQNQPKRLKRPVVISYYRNTNDKDEHVRQGIGTRTMVDDAIHHNINRLALAMSEEHDGLDREDVNNFFNYHKVTSVQPMLVELLCTDKVDALAPHDGKVISTISLLTGHDVAEPDLKQPYGTFGYYKNEVMSASKNEASSLFFAITGAYMGNIFTAAKERLDEALSHQVKLAGMNPLEDMDDDDETDGDGMII